MTREAKGEESGMEERIKGFLFCNLRGWKNIEICFVFSHLGVTEHLSGHRMTLLRDNYNIQRIDYKSKWMVIKTCDDIHFTFTL